MREGLSDRDAFESHYERRVPAPAHRRGTLPAVGVFLAGGRWRVAPFGSGAERALRAMGALLVASVTFDGTPVPAATGGGGAPGPPGPLLPWPPGEEG